MHQWMGDDLHYTLDRVVCAKCGGSWIAHLEKMFGESEKPAPKTYKWSPVTGKVADDELRTEQ